MVVMFLGFEQVHRQQFKAITHKLWRSYRTETRTFSKPHKHISTCVRKYYFWYQMSVSVWGSQFQQTLRKRSKVILLTI